MQRSLTSPSKGLRFLRAVPALSVLLLVLSGASCTRSGGQNMAESPRKTQLPAFPSPAWASAERAAFFVDGEQVNTAPERPVPEWQAYADVVLPRRAGGEVRVRPKQGVQADIRYRLQGANRDSALQVAEGLAVYPHALAESGADLVQEVSRFGTEDYVYFAQKPAQTSLTYKVLLVEGVRSVRMVGQQVEFRDDQRRPVLRVAPPYALQEDGTRVPVSLSIEGCAFSEDPLPTAPSAVTLAPGAECTLRFSWGEASYPLLVDPEWTVPSQLSSSFQPWAPQIFKIASGDVFYPGNASNPSQIWLAASGLWTATGTSTTTSKKLEGRAVKLNDGSILVFSGRNASNVEIADVQRYDPATGTWTVKASMPAARYRPNGVTLANNKVLVAGGSTGNGSTTYNTSHLYDPATNTWTASGTMTFASRDFGMIAVDATRVLAVAGGTSGTGCGGGSTGGTQMYTVASGTWAWAGAVLNYVAPDIIKMSNNKIMVGSSFCHSSQLWVYDPVANTWSHPADAGDIGNFSGQGMSELNGIVYIVGNQYSYPIALTYNVATQTSGYFKAYPAKLPVESATALLNDSRILLVDTTGETLTISSCGDGVLNTGEACDDGNAVSGDGCSATCATESGYTCNQNSVLSNGGFESPNIGGGDTNYSTGSAIGAWTVGAGGGVTLSHGGGGWLAPEGTQSVYLADRNGGGSSTSISQTFGVTFGHTYLWRLRMAGGPNPPGPPERTGTVVVSSGGTTNWAISARAVPWSTTYEIASGTFVAGTNSATITITDTSTQAWQSGIVVDDVRVMDMSGICSVCNGNYGSGATQACPVATPICNSFQSCTADGHPGCS